MKSTMRGTIAALACVLAAGTVALPPQPAAAQTLMDLFRGGPRVPPRSPLIRTEPAPPIDEAYTIEEARRSEPQPVVRGPRYYTYKADALRAVDLTTLADPVTTGAIGEEVPAADAGSLAAAFRYAADVKVEALPEVADAVEAFYAEAPAFIWSKDGRPTERAREAMRVLADADSVGLSAADYRVERPSRAGDAEERARDLLRFEMDLSTSVLTYVLDATRGRIDPNRISGYHDFDRHEVDLEATMAIVSRSLDVGTYLEQRNPNHDEFRALQAELKRLQTADEAERIDIADDTFIRPGRESDVLPNIVAAIRLKGSDALKTDHALVFADYSGETRYDGQLVELVKAFQKEQGLLADGIVGSNTVRALTGLSNADKIAKVRLAMERMRWLNRDLGDRHVIINVPAYRVTYTEDGEDVLSMRVVVGTKANQTYFFQDEIETVEYNPYWGVPRSIIVNEMLPKLRADPSYLDRLGYEVTTQSGTRIASSSVNWYQVGAQVPYNVRQPPGGSNALGELKILFPNAHAIYMHDTPAKDLFKRDTRAYSHGCVRLEDPRAMAAAVLGTTKEAVGQAIAKGHNQAVEVEADISVYVSYFTAWPNSEGEVQYFADIYERDMYLQRAIEATEAARRAAS